MVFILEILKIQFEVKFIHNTTSSSEVRSRDQLWFLSGEISV